MNSSSPKIAVLGATGSIGRSTLEVVTAAAGRLTVTALSAHRRLAELVAQSQQCRPRFVVAAAANLADRYDWSGLPAETELLVGAEGLETVARSDEVEIVVAAIVGSAGLRSTWAALEAGKRVALANKETLVVAGPLVRQLLHRHGGELLPVDSEHSAIFQALAAGRPARCSAYLVNGEWRAVSRVDRRSTRTRDRGAGVVSSDLGDGPKDHN